MTKRERLENDWTRAHAARLGINRVDYDQLRRDALRLRAWFTRECNGDIQRHDDGIPYGNYGIHASNGGKWKLEEYRTPDLETPARTRIVATCQRLGLHHYIQTDPRGGSLYVSDIPMTDSDYNRGLLIW